MAIFGKMALILLELQSDILRFGEVQNLKGLREKREIQEMRRQVDAEGSGKRDLR
jgi:hypothetical protein